MTFIGSANCLGAQACLTACFGQSVIAGNPAGKDGRRSQGGHCFRASQRDMKVHVEKIYPSKAVDIVGKRHSKVLPYPVKLIC
jgi:hypothetical protein